MKRVGLTGGIATGKTTVARGFAALGAAVVDADQIVHQLYATDSALQQELARIFGPQVQLPDGGIDRAALGLLVLPNATLRHRLEAIVHPRVRRQMEVAAAAHAAHGVALCIMDIPLLFESGGDWQLDAIVATRCDHEEQVARVMRRYGCDPATAESRIAAQMPLAEKCARADYCIDTGGTLEATQQQVASLYATLLAL